MKYNKIYLVLLTVLLTQAVYSQVTVTATAYTEIVNLVSANETVQLNFGRFTPESGGGSITISPDGIRMANGNIKLVEGGFSQGVFIITGSGNNSINVLLPSTPQYLYHFNSINRMYLDKWTYNIPKVTSGNIIINIGATLNVGSPESNPAGMYQGTYQVIFGYN